MIPGSPEHRRQGCQPRWWAMIFMSACLWIVLRKTDA
jgi:hypothetical protein